MLCKGRLLIFGVVVFLLVGICGTGTSHAFAPMWSSQETMFKYGASVEFSGEGPNRIVSTDPWVFTVSARVLTLNQSATAVTITAIRLISAVYDEDVSSYIGLREDVTLNESESWTKSVFRDEFWLYLGDTADQFPMNITFGLVWLVQLDSTSSSEIEYWSEIITIQLFYIPTTTPTPTFPIPGFPFEAVLLTLIITLALFSHRCRQNNTPSEYVRTM